MNDFNNRERIMIWMRNVRNNQHAIFHLCWTPHAKNKCFVAILNGVKEQKKWEPFNMKRRPWIVKYSILFYYLNGQSCGKLCMIISVTVDLPFP